MLLIIQVYAKYRYLKYLEASVNDLRIAIVRIYEL